MSEQAQTEAKPEVETAIPTAPSFLETKRESEKVDVPFKTKPANAQDAQEPTPETVKKVEEQVKGWQIFIVVIIVIGFSFGLILLYDKELRQKVIEALKKRMKKQ